MKELTLKPIRSIAGEVTLPGSKSLSNRALLLSALAEGTTSLNNLLSSDDIERMLVALRQLGVNLSLSEDGCSCSAVPEDGARPLGALALLGLLSIRRRRGRR